MLFFKRRIKKARNLFYKINETNLEIEKELLKVKKMLTICQK